jgi:hypothetical protein
LGLEEWSFVTGTVRGGGQTIRLQQEISPAAANAWIPGLWRWEIANVLQLNVRRGRNSGDFRDKALAILTLLP